MTVKGAEGEGGGNLIFMGGHISVGEKAGEFPILEWPGIKKLTGGGGGKIIALGLGKIINNLYIYILYTYILDIVLIVN